MENTHLPAPFEFLAGLWQPDEDELLPIVQRLFELRAKAGFAAAVQAAIGEVPPILRPRQLGRLAGALLRFNQPFHELWMLLITARANEDSVAIALLDRIEKTGVLDDVLATLARRLWLSAPAGEWGDGVPRGVFVHAQLLHWALTSAERLAALARQPDLLGRLLVDAVEAGTLAAVLKSSQALGKAHPQVAEFLAAALLRFAALLPPAPHRPARTAVEPLLSGLLKASPLLRAALDMAYAQNPAADTALHLGALSDRTGYLDLALEALDTQPHSATLHDALTHALVGGSLDLGHIAAVATLRKPHASSKSFKAEAIDTGGPALSAATLSCTLPSLPPLLQAWVEAWHALATALAPHITPDEADACTALHDLLVALRGRSPALEAVDLHAKGAPAALLAAAFPADPKAAISLDSGLLSRCWWPDGYGWRLAPGLSVASELLLEQAKTLKLDAAHLGAVSEAQQALHAALLADRSLVGASGFGFYSVEWLHKDAPANLLIGRRLAGLDTDGVLDLLVGGWTAAVARDERGQPIALLAARLGLEGKGAEPIAHVASIELDAAYVALVDDATLAPSTQGLVDALFKQLESAAAQCGAKRLHVATAFDGLPTGFKPAGAADAPTQTTPQWLDGTHAATPVPAWTIELEPPAAPQH